MDYTPLVRGMFERRALRTRHWGRDGEEIQQRVLRSLLRRADSTWIGFRHDFASIAGSGDVTARYARDLSPVEYEDIRPLVMRMISGERNLLWPGLCRDYAQSSGTSGGKSKFIPITRDSLHRTHYAGAADTVAHYILNNPQSRMFCGKGFILGGSFANELNLKDPRIHVGDLSATLINRCPPMANLVRIPSKRIALMSDWSKKLPRLVRMAAKTNITNLSGVPSWFLAVIKGVLEQNHTDNLHDVWPDLEVFFHGGISFEPYRQIYRSITDPERMHFVENYNASEGFFATQDRPDSNSMLLILDNDIYYEFIPQGKTPDDATGISGVETGGVYELMITSSNGLWRYRMGDTVRIESTDPVRISIVGRTKCYINAFGEELMEDNADKALAEACMALGCSVKDYTVSPVFADRGRRGRHQWLIEWIKAPADIEAFARRLDDELRKLNSDYDAKRSGMYFLDMPEIITVPDGTFSRWLKSVGTGKLGGQRKVPRLSNDRKIADQILNVIAASQS